ncbi:hypothetical protein L195_g026532 [Trifolium pratense]|uniref:Uncharacterized protein n=1 Tax=Trifolium pratense TaxID=57577 RepID=A0A2K3NJK6_TRIPR|nr:hypothetical protein L195_g026532 [Trifolium pratense]
MTGSACASSCCGSALIPKSSHSKTFFISPTPIAVIVGGNNNRIYRLRVRGSMVDSSSSADFTKRMEQTCNQGQLCVHLAAQKVILNANGAGVLVFLFLATTCFVKFHPETLAVLFALERDQHAALIVKEQAFVQSGWNNLLHPS